MDTKNLLRPTWIEINLDAITNNYNEFQKLLGSDIKIIPALKAHGYGHGLVPMAKHMVDIGMDILAVGNLYEAVILRKNGVFAPIQVFGSYLPESANVFVDYDLMPTFSRSDDVNDYADILGKDVKRKVWIKVETGLGRLGVFPAEVLSMLKNIYENTGFTVEGIYTHIGARAGLDTEEDINYCNEQWIIFEKLVAEIKEQGYNVPYYQAASTHAALALPQSWSNCVCLGSAAYADEITYRAKVNVNKKNSFQGLRSKLISIKDFKKDSQIGGVELQRDSKVGVAPIGLGDGWVGNNKGGDVIIRGKRCKIICGVSLEHTRIDITDVDGVSVGDVVTLIGKDQDQEITIDEMCQRIGCGTAQLWTSFNKITIPYVYFKNGRVVDVEIY